ncbi:MAG: HlyD family efflux transporter periplasmic adaptor subunit [Bacteroidetes bacterium]|nr:HlyD family efflux transporter periplasmic adaptor subunit [Bacteroidota bacterium]
MKRRQFVILTGIAIFIIGIMGMRYLSGLKSPSDRKPPMPTVRSVEYIEVENKDLAAHIPVTGKLVAKEKVELYAEVSGNLLTSASRFKEGNTFARGEILLAMDNTELLLNVQSLKSNFLSLITRVLPDLKLDYPTAFPLWKAYADAFDMAANLPPLPDIQSGEKYYLSTQGIYNQYYSIKSQEAKLAKYQIAAPFSGSVTQALIKPGTLVRAGQKLGEYSGLATYEMEAPVDVAFLSFVKVGAKGVLASPQTGEEFPASVVRISRALDPNSQNGKVILEVSSTSLKEGMYLNGYVFTETFTQVFAISKNQLNDKGEIFIIRDGVLEAKKIIPQFLGLDEVLTADLANGDKLLRTVFDGAQTGTPVGISDQTLSR